MGGVAFGKRQGGHPAHEGSFRLSIVCGRMHENPQSIIEWESRLSWLKCTQQYQEMDNLAQEDHAYKATKKELGRKSSHWTLQLNDLTFNGPMALRDDYKAAVSLNNHMYRRPEDYQKPSPPQYQDRQRRGCKFSETYRQGPNIG